MEPKTQQPEVVQGNAWEEYIRDMQNMIFDAYNKGLFSPVITPALLLLSMYTLPVNKSMFHEKQWAFVQNVIHISKKSAEMVI